MKIFRIFLGIGIIILGLLYGRDPNINDVECTYRNVSCGDPWTMGQTIIIVSSIILGVLILIGWRRIKDFLTSFRG